MNHEVTITMMELPYGCEGAHDVDFYEKVLRNILDAGIPFDSLAFKDASGTSTPRKFMKQLNAQEKFLDLMLTSDSTLMKLLVQA